MTFLMFCCVRYLSRVRRVSTLIKQHRRRQEKVSSPGIRTIARMDTIPIGHNPEGHVSEWTQSQMDTISNGHNLEWTPSLMDTIPNGHNPKWTQSQLNSIDSTE